MSASSDIERCLNKTFTPEFLAVHDDSARHAGHAGAIESGGGHYRIEIVADAFKDVARIERHRRIYAALSDMLPDKIHALAIDARSPDEN